MSDGRNVRNVGKKAAGMLASIPIVRKVIIFGVIGAISAIVLVAVIYSVMSYVEQITIAAYEASFMDDEGLGTSNLSGTVEAYRYLVLQEALKYGKEDYVDLFLAVMQQESGGVGEDVMQCAESLGLSASEMTAPLSIEHGVALLSGYLDAAGAVGPADIPAIRMALQAYNFGGSYIGWAKARDGCWTQENTDAFAEKMHETYPDKYPLRSGKRAERMGEWGYGDQYYTDHVLRYYTYGGSSSYDGTSSSEIVSFAMGFVGYPYVWGACGPDSFDCSGFIYYVFKEAGVYSGTRKTAAGYAEIATPIDKKSLFPGDLVFFQNANGSVYHVAIYIGNDNIVHAKNKGSGVCVDNIDYTSNTKFYGRLGGI